MSGVWRQTQKQHIISFSIPNNDGYCDHLGATEVGVHTLHGDHCTTSHTRQTTTGSYVVNTFRFKNYTRWDHLPSSTPTNNNSYLSFSAC